MLEGDQNTGPGRRDLLLPPSAASLRASLIGSPQRSQGNPPNLTGLGSSSMVVLPQDQMHSTPSLGVYISASKGKKKVEESLLPEESRPSSEI